MSTSTRSRYGLRHVFGLLLAAVLAAPALVQPACAQGTSATPHMLWRVASEANGTEGYLVGSVHVMKKEAYPLDSVFREAFSEADVLVLEANLDSMQVKAKTLVRELALYPPGTTLKKELPDETYAMLEKRAEKIGLNLAQMQRMEPWMVSIMIPTRQMQKAGYSQNQGLDRHFFDKAKKAGTSVRALETAEEQMRFFDDLSPEKQEAYLRQSLKKADRTVENFDKIVRYWRTGNASGIEEMMVEQMKNDAPALYERLITERNATWMPRLTEILESEALPMIVVGAGHVVGANGLVELLREKGYRVEQL
ncbi:TraB/GumN family protein [Salinibacter ruber]|uniref:TraB/GumN family protein n=1 Tax=Salinibacter ruber TaxID=146919 RepID=UPI00216892D7|nr:TraB/GumN family protein [Salinibacter ruber]MCS3697095.1 hypothetical protein [Salinibacter ruber]